MLRRHVNPRSSRNTTTARTNNTTSASVRLNSSAASTAVQSRSGVSSMPASRAWSSTPATSDDPFDGELDDDDFGAMIAAADMAERQHIHAASGQPSGVTTVTPDIDFSIEDDEDDLLAAAAEQAEQQLSAGSDDSSDVISTTVTDRTGAVFRVPPAVVRSPLTVNNKRPRPVDVRRLPEVLSVAEAAGVDYDGGRRVAKILGFVEATRMEILENPVNDAASRPYFLTMPVTLCDGNDFVKAYLGTSVSFQVKY